MSNIFAYRERVLAFVRENIPELREVDWYDGLFDEQDIRDWSLQTPCAFVAITNAEAVDFVTGESSVPLDCVMVVIAQDRRAPRDADEICWTIIEKAALSFRQQTFGDPNTGVAERIKFKRLKDPAMRRESVAIGVVTWRATLTLGTNVAARRDMIFDMYGQRITKVPDHLSADIRIAGTTTLSPTETVPEDIGPRPDPWHFGGGPGLPTLNGAPLDGVVLP